MTTQLQLINIIIIIIMVRKKGPVEHGEFFLVYWTLKNEGNTSIWNVHDHSPNNTTSYPQRPEPSITPLRKLKCKYN